MARPTFCEKCLRVGTPMKAEEPGVVLFRLTTFCPFVLTKMSVHSWVVAVKLMPRNESNCCSRN